MPLRRDAPFHIAHVTDGSGGEFAEHVVFDGTSWFHVTRGEAVAPARQRRQLGLGALHLHGAPGGIVREAVLGPIQSRDLLATLHRLCHVRALVALDRLELHPRSLGAPMNWSNVFTWTMWVDCRWPRSLRRLVFGREKGLARTGRRLLAAFQAKVLKTHPSLVIEA